MMPYRRSRATKRLVALLLALIGAAGGPVQVGAADDSGYELHWEVHVSPSGPLKVCLNDTRDIAFSVTSWAEYRNSMRVVRGGLTPTNVTVRQRGVTGWQGVTAEANVRLTFDQLGREQIEIQAASYGWSRREAEYPGTAIIDVEVVKCRYEVEVRSIWHLTDGGFEPVLGSLIDRTPLTLDAATARYSADPTASNVAVAFPRFGCTVGFNVDDTQAHVVGSLVADGRYFHLEMTWEQGRSKIAGTGVVCGVPGGTTDPFQIASLVVDLPAEGVATPNAQPTAHTMTSRNKSYVGTTFVTLRRFEDAP